MTAITILHRRREEAADAAVWLALVGAGLALTAAAVALDLRVGVPGAPFTGDYRVKVEVGTLLAPLVAVGLLSGVRAGLTHRLGWPTLMLAGYLGTVAWTVALALVDGGNGLATPVTSPADYRVDLPVVGEHPGAFVRDFVERQDSLSVATRTHPPAPLLLLWAFDRAGVTQPLIVGLLITVLGCATTPFVAIATRSLCGEDAARRLLPALVLAPYAVWVAVSMDAVTSALCAASVATGVLASESGRRPRWAITSGVLLGVAALFSYTAPWLGAVPLIVCFLRRRGTTIALIGAGALVPLSVARAMGFVWPDGLTGAQRDFSLRVAANRSWPLWAALDLVLLVVACGPVVVSAARRIRRTPGWPFVVGAALAVAFAVGSGLARGEVERSWLPFFPWLLVPTTAPASRAAPADDGADPPRSDHPSLLLLALGAGAAVVIESVLRSAW